MYQVIIVVHVLLGLGVIGFVLIQQGKGADAGAAFGSSSGTVFGAQGASSFLSRTTAILAALFFATSLGLAVLSGNIEGEADLMEAGEEVFADVPLVNEVEVIPAIDTLPVIDEELPAEVKKIQQEIATMAEEVNVEADKVADTVETEADKVVVE